MPVRLSVSMTSFNGEAVGLGRHRDALTHANINEAFPKYRVDTLCARESGQAS